MLEKVKAEHIALAVPLLPQLDGVAVAGVLSRALVAKWKAGRVVVLGLLSVGLWLLLVVVGRVVAARLDYRLAVAAAFGVRQLFALLRVWLGLSLVAAAAELHDGVTSDVPVKSPAQTY